jgi:DNA modification methylase
MVKRIIWKSEKRKISELIPAEYNPRELTELQAKELSTSLERFNLADPIVINLDNTIIGGHQRINILKQSGDLTVDVRVPSRSLTKDEERELNLRLNKNLGQWDYDLLANFDEAMLKDVGFDSKDIDKIFQLDTKPEDDDVPEARTTKIKLGDLYQLGAHRLLCGDSTKKEDVERLMAGEKADMVFTDPPYGVDYSGGIQFTDSGVKTEQRERIANDDIDLYDKCIPMMAEFCNGAIYTWFAGTKAKSIYNAIDEVGDIHALLIWVKNGGYGAMNANYKQKHEPCLYWKPKGKNLNWVGNTTECTIWEIDKDGKNKLHPTQKPIALAEKGITNSSPREGIVMDLFGGSGSTLIACEKLNRKCRMMEIDCTYVDVIIRRWEAFTGQKAVKL